MLNKLILGDNLKTLKNIDSNLMRCLFLYKEQAGLKPSIIIDKTGIQKHKFKAGTHHIAVKVIDNDSLDNIEVIKLKVNGKVEVG